MRIPEVYAPGTLDEALALKAEHGSSLEPLAGGTDVIPGIRSGACTAEKLLDLSGIDDLRGIRENGTRIDIGALTTHARVAESATVRTHLPLLAEACGSVGSVQIRNLGTVGGNLSNASPAADSIPPLIVLGAACKIRSASNEREVLMSAYCTCPGGTCLSPEELLTEIGVPKMPPGYRGFYLKLGQRRAMAIAKVSVAFLAKQEDGTLSDVRIALGAVAPTVCGAPETVAFLENHPLNDRTIERGAKIVASEAHPIADIRSTVEYRREMVGVLLAKGLRGFLT